MNDAILKQHVLYISMSVQCEVTVRTTEDQLVVGPETSVSRG